MAWRGIDSRALPGLAQGTVTKIAGSGEQSGGNEKLLKVGSG
jgi:hypothetical protein